MTGTYDIALLMDHLGIISSEILTLKFENGISQNYNVLDRKEQVLFILDK